ncbi:MAG: PilZ domain-containing protein [Desulfatitalea sp.]
MSNFEKITGPKVVEIIHELISGKTLVKVSIPKKDFERLTIVIGTRTEGGVLHFQIDPPEGLWMALQKADQPETLRFEFLDETRLPHRFEAPLNDYDQEIWLQCPEYIQRYQLRNDFRIKAPANAHATALINETELKMHVDNISLGGLYCHCPNSAKAMLFKDQIIENLDLVFTFGGEYQMLSIGRAVVRRLEGRTRQRHFGVAFEFAQMNTEVKKRLTQIIYGLQRDYLKNRMNNGYG